MWTLCGLLAFWSPTLVWSKRPNVALHLHKQFVERRRFELPASSVRGKRSTS